MAEKKSVDLNALAAAEQERQKALKAKVYACAGTGCISLGCRTVAGSIHQALETHGLQDVVEVVPTGCLGLCSLGPLVRVEVIDQKPVLYKEVSPLLGRVIVLEHLIPALNQSKDVPFEMPEFLHDHVLSLEIPFFSRQQKRVLTRNGRINPERIEEYIAQGGYLAIQKALTEMTPDEVIEIISASGLRGRGGGGFPTGDKWRFCQLTPGEEKFVICNGDEGDPGAYMDRSILEGDPHAVLEGMMIAAYAVGASEGWFYVRAEYPLAVQRMEKAIRDARRHGLLGKGLFGTDFNFDCQVRLGAGAFVCGEETALIHSLEGLRGTPRPRPPYPSVKGLWEKPTCVNNVETLANVALIIHEGPEPFASIGTETSKGTKVFALAGKVKHSGLIEVPMGMPLREIVEEIGGGTSSGLKVKAAQTGGPSGGVIPADMLDNPVCYEKLKEMGSMMGSGGLIVMDEDDSMVGIAAFYLGFTVDESCGKCAPCRIGGVQMLGVLEKILHGQGTEHDIQLLHDLARAMQKASLCGLGQTAANPVVSTLRYFEDEYMEKIKSATHG